jgi:formyl-CoA transferase
VARLVASRTRAQWEQLAAAHDLPLAAVHRAGEALAHPQVAAREVARRAVDGLLRLGYPARIDGARPRAAAAVPELGADTLRVLAEHGLDRGLSARALRAEGLGPGRRGPAGRLRRLLRRWLVRV